MRHAEGGSQGGTPVENRLGALCRSCARIKIESGSIDANDLLTAALFDFAYGFFQVRRERPHDCIDTVFQEDLQHGNDPFPGLIFLDEIILGETGVRPAQEPVRSNQKAWQAYASDSGARKRINVGHIYLLIFYPASPC